MSDFDRLVHLADDLYARYEVQGNASDLSLCIVHYRSALTLANSSTTLPDDTRGKLLSNLANALSIRFQRHEDLADLDHSVEYHLTALDFRPPGHPGRANTLSNFATTLLVRYGHLNVQQDIELAIKHFSTALPILPPDGRLIPLMNYASALFSRFQHSGDIADLSNAIYQYRAVVDSSPIENRSTSNYNLANALLSRFKLEGDPKDLELCINYSAIALHNTSNDHPDRSLALSCFSTALIRRFELYSASEDLQNAVEHFKSALELQSTQDSAQFMPFYDLADALVMRYRLHSNISDLELAIEHYRTALGLLSPDHKDKGVLLDNLGSALSLRFSRLGVLSDLEEAVQKHFCALVIHPKDSPRRVNTLEALGTCVYVRFQQFHNSEDLHTAINLFNEALVDISHEHTRRAAILDRSSSSLEARFRLYGRLCDLDRSISHCREALELRPPHHSDQATSFQVLVSSLIFRFEETGDEFDLDEAYLHCSTCMNLRHTSDTTRAVCNLQFARILRARVLPWGTKDVESIFQHLHFAKDLCTLSHPLMSDIYAELASTYYLRFLVDQRPSDLHDALGHHELSMNVVGGSMWPAFHAAFEWIRNAEMYGHRSGVDIYRNTLRLADRYILTLSSPELRQRVARRQIAYLAYNGAAFALRLKEPAESVEVLEGGRSVLWSQLIRARTCLDELRLTGEHGASLVDSYERLILQLERLPRTCKSPSAKDVKHMLKEKEAVVDQIRRIEGFKNFLLTTPYTEFDKAARDGPVIVLNASRCTCDAIVLVYNIQPIHIRLSGVTPLDVSHMAARFRELTRDPTVGDENKSALEDLLSDLWDDIVSPIVHRVLHYAPMGSRVWWCPCGVFTSIPLHAAGPYRKKEPCLSNIYISSYTPTLQALIRARYRRTRGDSSHSSRRPHVLPGFLKRKSSKKSLGATDQMTPNMIVAIGITKVDGINGTTYTAFSSDGEMCRELDLVRNRIPPGMSFRRLEGEEDVTAETLLAAFRDPSAWLHIACPTILDTSVPSRSGFATRDGVVSLHDISQARPRAQFAFVSGRCHHHDDGGNSYPGNEAGSEEVMHLATSLQYCGVQSVVGTLWPVDDRALQKVAGAFYEQIVPRAGELMQSTNAARSLNEVLKLVGMGLPLAQKIAFMHVGI